MDKNSSIGFLLIMGILLGWYFWFSPKSETQQPAPADTLTHTTSKTPTPSVQDTSLKTNVEGFEALTSSEVVPYSLKTDKYTVTLQSKGGSLQRLTLNDHLDQNKKPLDIIPNHPENVFAEEFTYKGKSLRTDLLQFKPQSALPTVLKGNDSAIVSLRAALDETHYLEKSYTFYGNRYDITYNFRVAGLQSDIKDNSYTLYWKGILPRTEQSLDIQRQKTTIVYGDSEGIETLSLGPDDKETPEKPINWVAFRSQFFTNTLVPSQPFSKSELNFYTPVGEELNKIMDAKLIVNLDKSQTVSSQSFRIYSGPLDYYLLASYGNHQLHKQMDLGWGPVKYINRVMMWVFKKLEGLKISYGLIIVLFGILIKLLILPMTYKSYISMAKMKVLNQMPEITSLDEKYADDPQKAQMEKMQIYNSMGVSPLGGCLPMLLQYPIMISIFFLLPQAVELRHQPFLWAHDLSTYDSILNLPFRIPAYGSHVSLFTLLMAISTMAFTYYNQATQPTSGNAQMQMQMKIMMYLMPIFLLFFLNGYASGLTWYYFVSNILAVLQTIGFRYFIDDEKLEAQLHATKTANANSPTKGKSKLSRWVEEQQKKQEGGKSSK